ncbi:GNAT family N-acetyltransferase [Paenibacillus chartarius]|uniref:GNAT family N-acetyltransferase n=1 Tax=Paenibacillus chartarius TaxID=747481 RepID=A0ABV6DT81_9BACL
MAELHQIDGWDAAWWAKAEPIYDHAFPKEGRKPERVIRSLLERGVGSLYVLTEEGEPVAMAIAGIVRKHERRALVIDYLAVAARRREEGYGRELIGRLKQQVGQEQPLDMLVIEVEAEDTPDNRGRIRFWQRCGFQLTSYVHTYIWVPEPYRAMVLPLRQGAGVPLDGETLFSYITDFHQRAYRGR